MPSSPLGATVLVDMLFLTLNWSISQRWTAMSVLPFILHFPGAFQGLQGMRRRQTRGSVSDRKTVAYTPRAPGLHDSSRAALPACRVPAFSTGSLWSRRRLDAVHG